MQMLDKVYIEKWKMIFTLGQLFLFTLYLWKALPALRIGLSILPPPAIHPTMARLADGIT